MKKYTLLFIICITTKITMPLSNKAYFQAWYSWPRIGEHGQLFVWGESEGQSNNAAFKNFLYNKDRKKSLIGAIQEDIVRRSAPFSKDAIINKIKARCGSYGGTLYLTGVHTFVITIKQQDIPDMYVLSDGHPDTGIDPELVILTQSDDLYNTIFGIGNLPNYNASIKQALRSDELAKTKKDASSQSHTPSQPSRSR
jgi:hypothetical protein